MFPGLAMPEPPPHFSRRVVYGYLEKYFGHEEFRPGQTDVIRSLLGEKETVAVLPTGGGKSLCYQLPALLLPGTTLVISPLIALMRDQVMALRQKGIPAASLDSNQDSWERQQVEQDFAEGRLKLLYVSPERLASPRFLDLLKMVEVPFVAVDEAHCVLRWGHEFREAYLGIKGFLEELKPPRVGGFTATATPQLRTELAEALGLEDPNIYVRGFFRQNLCLSAEKAVSESDRLAKLMVAVRERDGQAPALAYAATRQATEDAVEVLRHAGLRAAFYHGGCEPEHRSQVQDAFLADELDCLVATNAFGMGIDKPDIRLLVHLSLPRSFEDYYQEVGRAGRDGLPSEACVLWRGKDYRTQDFLIEQQPDQGYREAAKRRLNRLYDCLRGGRCLWVQILEYFGDPDVAALAEDCGACERCAEGGQVMRVLEGDERDVGLALLGCVRQLDGRYGRTKMLKILKGSGAKGIPTWPAAYGMLGPVPMATLEAMVQAMLDGGYLSTVGSEYPMLGLGPKARQVLDEEFDLELALGSDMPAPKTKKARASAGAEEQPDLEPEALELLEALKVWRQRRASEKGVPAYCILSNKSLEGVARVRPANEGELLSVHGIGPSKHEEFGAELLAMVGSE